jgi:membrane protease YdiL (CAAX protease family)
MSIIAESQRMQIKFRRSWITLGLIIGLFVLRYLLTASRIIFIGGPWVIPVYEVGTYILVATLLIWERRALVDYHIPPLAIWMIVLFRPLETLYYPLFSLRTNDPMAFPGMSSIFIWLTAVGLIIALRSQLFRTGNVRRQEWIWILIGLGIGLADAIVISYPASLQFGPFSSQRKDIFIPYLVQGLLGIPQQIGYAAVPEEPVFRAFLWGYLRKSGWRDMWIWLFQAGLFSLAHLYYLSSAPISFWFVVPFGGLVLGWLAWRSRSIATSMVAHGVSNSMGSTLAYLIAVFRT